MTEALAGVPEDTITLVYAIRAEDLIDPVVRAALADVRQTIETAELPSALLEGVVSFRGPGTCGRAVPVMSSATAGKPTRIDRRDVCFERLRERRRRRRSRAGVRDSGRFC